MQKAYVVNTLRVISETLDGETIIINLENGSYYSMNHAGTAIWNAIGKGESINISEKSVADFMDFLQKEELINETKTPESAAPATQGDFANPKIDKYDDMQAMLLADPIHDVDAMGWPKLKDK